MSAQENQTVKDYINLHKHDNPDTWLLQCKPGSKFKQYAEIYQKLVSGEFGECRTNAGYDESGKLVKNPTEFEIDIPGYEAKSGKPVTFCWEIPSSRPSYTKPCIRRIK